jgi:predicted ArsR family transcriptional regulator
VEFVETPSPLAAGSSPAAGEASTRLRVARSILENGSSTAADLAQRLGLTPAAVRRHLDHLVEQGAVEAVEQRPAAARGRGRPARHFRLTAAGRDRFDHGYDDLAAEALRFLAETGGDDAVAAFARRRVSFIERDFHAVAASHPELSSAEVLARVLSNEGYAATVRELPVVSVTSTSAVAGVPAGTAEQLCQQHCPVSHVAHEFPQLCEAETEAISKVLGTHVARLATIAHGDGVCTTCIPDSKHTPHSQDGASA